MSEDVYTIPEPTNDTYETLRLPHPGEPSASKKNGYKAATVCLGLLCVLLSVGIVGLVIHNHLVTDLDQILSRYSNLTELNDLIQSMKRRLCETRGFTFDGAVCYNVSTEKKTWEESRQYCRDRRSDLMVINNKEEQDLVVRVTGSGRDDRMWLGLTDGDEEEVWMWVDGTPLTTPTYWRGGEPNNQDQHSNAEEDCLEFVGWNLAPGWNDRACSAMNYWICEMY